MERKNRTHTAAATHIQHARAHEHATNRSTSYTQNDCREVKPETNLRQKVQENGDQLWREVESNFLDFVKCVFVACTSINMNQNTK